MPKTPTKDLYIRLALQCSKLGIPILQAVPDTLAQDFDVIVDGIFGFSFVGDVKSPFDTVIAQLNASALPIVAIDIPSGWDVEKGPPSQANKHYLQAQVLVSLTAPKKCALHFVGKHYVGGRFVPFEMAQAYELNLPAYSGTDIIVQLVNEPKF